MKNPDTKPIKNVPKLILSAIGILLCYFSAQGQDAASYFHNGANFFIKGNSTAARQTLQQGLSRYPNDSKLNSLLKEIKDEEEKKQEQEKQKQEQEKQEQKKQEQQQKEQQQKKEQQQREEQQKKEQQQAQNQPGQQREQPKEEKSKEGKETKEREATTQKLKQMNLTEEKARMILEAMKNNEVQYLQQRRREKTQKTDPSKPDW